MLVLVLKKKLPRETSERPRRRACITHVSAKLDVSERFACQVGDQHRFTQPLT